MSPRSPRTVPHDARPLRRALASLVLLTVATGCSGDGSATPATLAATTSSSTSPSTSTTTSSTSTTSTTLPDLPVLAPAPTPGAIEPEIALGTMEIPAIDLSETLYEGVALTTLDRGPGHWPGSAMPGGYGNVVVGGHRTSHTRPFYYIDRLAPGDEIIYTTDAGRFVYVITETIIVTPDEMWVIQQTPGYTTTLFACHPLHSTAQRIIIRATLQTT